MYRHKKNSNRWAQPVADKGKYLTNDGQWWDGDRDTLLFLKSLERPVRESDEGRFKPRLTNARIIEVLEDTGYIKKAA